jgi:hypothetical protein
MDKEYYSQKYKQPFPTINYLTHISEKYNYVYTETPKAACTSIKYVLQSAERGSEIKLENPGIVHDRSISPLSSISNNIETYDNFFIGDKYFHFAFTRNPITRILSCWLDKLNKNQHEKNRLAPKLGLNPTSDISLRKFLEIIAEQTETEHDIHWATQTFLLRPNIYQYSFLGKFENFEYDFEKVCSFIGIMEFFFISNGKWHGTNANLLINKYIGASELSLIHKIYKNDFKNFGYGWSTKLI